MDPTTRNIARLHEALAAFNDSVNRNRYFDLYDEHIIFHGYADNLVQGLASLKDYYQQIWSVLDAPIVVVDDIVGSADVVACRYTLSGIHIGPFMGIPGTNRQFSVEGMTFLRFKKERCVERWQGMDQISLLRQLST